MPAKPAALAAETHPAFDLPALHAGQPHNLIATAKLPGGQEVARLWRSRLTAEGGETAAFDLEILNADFAWRTACRIGHPAHVHMAPAITTAGFAAWAGRDGLLYPGAFEDFPLAHRVAACAMLREVA